MTMIFWLLNKQIGCRKVMQHVWRSSDGRISKDVNCTYSFLLSEWLDALKEEREKKCKFLRRLLSMLFIQILNFKEYKLLDKRFMRQCWLLHAEVFHQSMPLVYNITPHIFTIDLQYIYQLKVMDPRPYHFDYRRPRVTNPTYLSKQLYDRIQQHQQTTARPQEHPSNPEITRAQSTDLKSLHKSQLDSISSRYNSRGSLPSGQKLNNSMANYGRSIMGRSRGRMEQEEVFERQERNFNIISCWPRAVQPTLHRFPKLTLQDKLLQLGIGSNP